MLGAGGTAVSAMYLKDHLVRPLDVGERIAGNSFPSGHVAVASVLAGALVVATRGAVRVLMAVVGVALVLGMGYATVVLQWHRPSDGVGAVLLACSSFAAATVVAHVVRRAAEGRRLRVPARRATS